MHLKHTADLAEQFGEDAGLLNLCRLTGLAHDLGKYRIEFQRRLNDPNIACPHSAAGAVVLEKISADALDQTRGTPAKDARIVAKYLRLAAYTVICHHGGLRDVLTEDGRSYYDERIEGCITDAQRNEVYKYGAEEIEKLKAIAASPGFGAECAKIETYLNEAKKPNLNEAKKPNLPDKINTNHAEFPRKAFFASLVARYLFSVLVDADRTDTIRCSVEDYGEEAKIDQSRWREIAQKVDRKVQSFPAGALSRIRNEIYSVCAVRSEDRTGLYSLNVPTGGGKTLAGFRFSAGHAAANGLKRVFFVLPYLSIIEQNAAVIRGVLGEENASILSEIHSNIVRGDAASDTRDETGAPDVYTDTFSNGVVFTTLVGFLESVFKDGTRGIRRFHNMARSVLIFDEIQALPFKCTGFFNQLTEFLTGFLASSVVLTSATEPCLDRVGDDRFHLPKPNPIILKQYPEMRRVEYEIWKPDNVSLESVKSLKRTEEVVQRVVKRKIDGFSSLVVVNTKDAARTLYRAIRGEFSDVFHLSTAMCAKHRSAVIRTVKTRLARGEKIVLVSTQLVEAGVDLDFDTVFRSVAGIDNIVQAAGRCNREGKTGLGKVIVFRYEAEKLESLHDIRIRAVVTERLLDGEEFRDAPDGDAAIRAFFLKYYAMNDRESAGFNGKSANCGL